MEYIGAYAFACCNKLKKLIIPDGVTELCDNVFEECGAEYHSRHRYPYRIPDIAIQAT